MDEKNCIKEFTVNVSGGEITNLKRNPDGSTTIKMEISGADKKPKIKFEDGLKWVRIPVSKITLNDYFLEYVPSTKSENKLKDEIEKAISKENVEDFFICEDFSIMPGYVGYPTVYMDYGKESCNEWIRFAEKNGWQICNRSKYFLLIAFLIKVLVENEGWEKAMAWSAFSEDSELLAELDWKKIFGFETLRTLAKRYLLPDEPENEGCYIACGGINDGYGRKYPLAEVVGDWRRDCRRRNSTELIYGFIIKK